MQLTTQATMERPNLFPITMERPNLLLNTMERPNLLLNTMERPNLLLNTMSQNIDIYIKEMQNFHPTSSEARIGKIRKSTTKPPQLKKMRDAQNHASQLMEQRGDVQNCSLVDSSNLISEALVELHDDNFNVDSFQRLTPPLDSLLCRTPPSGSFLSSSPSTNPISTPHLSCFQVKCDSPGYSVYQNNADNNFNPHISSNFSPNSCDSNYDNDKFDIKNLRMSPQSLTSSNDITEYNNLCGNFMHSSPINTNHVEFGHSISVDYYGNDSFENLSTNLNESSMYTNSESLNEMKYAPQTPDSPNIGEYFFSNDSSANCSNSPENQSSFSDLNSEESTFYPSLRQDSFNRSDCVTDSFYGSNIPYFETLQIPDYHQNSSHEEHAYTNGDSGIDFTSHPHIQNNEFILRNDKQGEQKHQMLNFPNKSSSEAHSFEDETMIAKLESYEDDAENDEAVRICKWVDCNAVFYDRASLSKHIERAHVDQRKGDDFTCFWAACQRKYRAFNARYKLLIHMRVHSGEKPNKCGYRGCSKAFSRLENLKIHVRSHTGERPYVCMHALCAKAFSNSSDRAKHQRTHLTAKPYACSVPHCRKSYTDPSSLRKHVKNHSQRDQLLARSKSGSLSLCDGTRPDAEDQSEASKFAKSATAVDGDLVRFSLRCHVLSRVDGQTEALGALGALGDLPTPSQEDLDAWIS